jgi:hypothetical protein
MDDIDGTINELLEENSKLKDELRECISDNNLLTQHV